MQHTKTDYTICIPRVDNSIERQYIFETIRELKIGFIDKITEIPLKTDSTGKRIIIKFKTWVDNSLSQRIKNRLDNNKDIKIVYNEPFYWTIQRYVKN